MIRQDQTNFVPADTRSEERGIRSTGRGTGSKVYGEGSKSEAEKELLEQILELHEGYSRSHGIRRAEWGSGKDYM